ncbi:5-hydroxytryptamine (serotonin) receptor 1A a [Tachysurus fulvidraco]|uniref:5-hydroxytryptamine (serotonin) receptor 1A a n=1 Tax=Tachysurus fulvidraco TaxID=1234273 RepID=UPI000F4D7014|nr:5-hydroxytryptamine (serotonin) receptor 1A a [Tachysurus fulvidraco]
MMGWRKPEDPNACSIRQDPVYTVYSTFGAFYLPLVIMLVLYRHIFRAARFRIRKNFGKSRRVSARIPDHDEISVNISTGGATKPKTELMDLRAENCKRHFLSLSNISLFEQKNWRSLDRKRKAALARERRR